jgi:hypothetical protein
VEVINTTTFLVNRSPTAANQGMMPEDKYSNKKPDVSFLHIFGCLAYLHVPKKDRKKLDNKTIKYLMMGYDDNSKAYEPQKKKILISRDVVFDETKLGMTSTEISNDLIFPNILDGSSNPESLD